MKFKRLSKNLSKIYLKIFIIFILLIIILNTHSFAKEQNSETLSLYSDAAILMDCNTGELLYSKNANKIVYPASTTKVLTAILAIEKGNLSDLTTTSRDAIIVIPSGYSSAYLSEGEQLTLGKLLELLLIHSANDAANVIAEHIAGSIDNFVDLMNEKAQELGCTNTHFVNTNGIHNENHYTTAYDLAIITKYCMQNSTFRKIVSMPNCTIPATNKADERTYSNTNDLINPNSSYYYQYCIGGKTGFTSQAKNCLISISNKDGLELISVVLGASQTSDGKSARYVDTTALFEYGYNTYSNSVIAKQYDIVEKIEIPNGSSSTKDLDLLLANDITALINLNDQSEISYDITLKDNLSAPIYANSVVGSITYYVGDSTYTEDLLASHDVKENTFLIWIIRASLTIICLIIAFVIIFKITEKNKYRYNY